MTMTMTLRLLLLTTVLSVIIAACRPGGDEAPQAPEPSGEAATEAAAAEPEGTPCTPTTARELIEGLALEDEASGCTVYLPLDPEPGSLTVRVSAAGTEDTAAVEWSEDGQRVFADRGEVELTSIDGGRLTGVVRAEASAGSRVLRAAGEFSVALPGAP